MNRIEELKTEVPLDLWLVAMLYHGVSVTQVSQKAGVSRQAVYTARNRVKTLLVKYNLLDITTKPE